MLRLKNVDQIVMLATLGSNIFWSNETYKVKLTKGKLYIVHDNGYTETVLDAEGNLKDKPNEFFIREVQIRGRVISTELDLQDYLADMVSEEHRLKLEKGKRMKDPTLTLQSKINAMHWLNGELRKHYDHADYVLLHLWRITDVVQENNKI